MATHPDLRPRNWASSPIRLGMQAGTAKNAKRPASGTKEVLKGADRRIVRNPLVVSLEDMGACRCRSNTRRLNPGNKTFNVEPGSFHLHMIVSLRHPGDVSKSLDGSGGTHPREVILSPLRANGHRFCRRKGVLQCLPSSKGVGCLFLAACLAADPARPAKVYS